MYWQMAAHVLLVRRTDLTATVTHSPRVVLLTDLFFSFERIFVQQHTCAAHQMSLLVSKA